MTDIKQPRLKKDGTPWGTRKKSIKDKTFRDVVAEKTPDQLDISAPEPELENKPQDRGTNGRFLPGNKVTHSPNSMRASTYEFRKRCDAILKTPVFLESLITMLTLAANDGRFKEYIEIITFLADRAYGKPRESTYEDDDSQTKQVSSTTILVSKEDILSTLSGDKNYE